MDYLTYKEFLQKYQNPKCNSCEGCLESLIDYLKNAAPDSTSYADLKIPKKLYDEYDKWMSEKPLWEKDMLGAMKWHFQGGIKENILGCLSKSSK